MKWRPTWDDKADDFVCLNEQGEVVARMYRHHDGRWNWHMNAWDFHCMSGIVDGHPRAAAVAAEEAYGLARPVGYAPA